MSVALDGLCDSGIGQELIFENHPVAVGFGSVLQPGTIIGLGDWAQQAAEVHPAGFRELD